MWFRFIGKDGSLGLKKNVTYKVILRTGNKGVIARIQDPFLRTWVSCPYNSLSSFLKNWKEVG